MERPSVIHLDFPALPRQDGKRVSKLAENGKLHLLLASFPIRLHRRQRTLILTLTLTNPLCSEDAILSNILSLLPSPSYTVIYTTTPTSSNPSQSSDSDSDSVEEPSLPYQMDDSPIHQNPIHIDLKRDLSTHQKRDSSGEEDSLPPGPLFERYSFLSPGLFMGILVTLILLSILYVGISAIAGLEVSYAAFDKELGPLGAGKKA